MSTNFQIGFVTNKNSSKVLRPPGGGSSDIFAADSASTPRSIKNHMKSNIFAAPSPVRGGTTDNHARRPQVDSHNRLFGDNSVSVTPAKNRQNSNIPIGGDAPDSSLKHSNGNGHTNSSREHININGNGSEKNGSSLNGEISKPSGENAPPNVVNKNRIPPGGFSSGLW